MKQLSALLSACLLFAFVSCNSGEQSKDQTAAAPDTTAATKAPEPPAFQPFTLTLVKHKVKDFDKWLAIYDAHDSSRKASGLTEYALGRGLDTANVVYLAFKADDIQKAKAFTSSPDLKAAMQKGGVSGPPSIAYVTVVRNDNSPTDVKERMLVVHHVKDYDAWLKVYDSEGKATRSANGLLDRGIARGIDDPNTVYVVFAITDLAKAKARANSPELKKLMTDAGVDGLPTVSFYKMVR